MKRTLSLVLSLLMVLSLFTGLSVSAQTVGDGSVTRVSDDPDTRESGIAGTGADTDIAETGDEPVFETRYISTAEQFKESLEDDGNITLNIAADIDERIRNLTKIDSLDTYYIQCVGNKVINLNGHTVNFDYQPTHSTYVIGVSGWYDHIYTFDYKSLLIQISNGASLVVNDTYNTGEIRFKSAEEDTAFMANHPLNYVVFNVLEGGELTVNGGTIEGGNAYKQYIVQDAFHKGDAYIQTRGDAILLSGGSATINGGTFLGRDNRYASVRVEDDKSKLTINDGEFWGRGGADAIRIPEDNQNTVIRGGTFKLHKQDLPEITRITGINTFHEYVGDYEDVEYGKAGIPSSAIDTSITQVHVQGQPNLTPDQILAGEMTDTHSTTIVEPKPERTGELKKYIPSSDSYGTQTAGETYTWDKVTSLRFQLVHDHYYPFDKLHSYDQIRTAVCDYTTACIRATADGENLASIGAQNSNNWVDLNTMSAVDKEKLQVGSTYYLRRTGKEIWDNYYGRHEVNFTDNQLVKIKIVEPDYTMPSASVGFNWSNSVDELNKNKITLTPDLSNLDLLVRSGTITRYSGTFYYTNNYASSASYTTVKPYTTASFYRGISKVKYTATLYKGTTKLGTVSKEQDVVCFPDITASKTITGFDTVNVPGDASDKMVVLSVASNSVTGLFWTKDGSRIGGSTMERSVDLSNIANCGLYSIGYTVNGVNYYRDKGLYLKTQIASVAVTGVVEPAAGAKPSYSASVPSGKGYQVQDYDEGEFQNGINWYNETDHKTMTGGNTFEGGKRYKVCVILEPADDSCSFASSVSGTLNGLNASITTYSDGTIRISCTFTCPNVLNALHVNGQPKATIVVNGSSVNASSTPPHTYVTLEESTQAEFIDSKWQIPGSQGGKFEDYTGAFTGDNPYYYPVYTIAPMDGTSFASKVHITFDGETAVTATRNADGTITVRGPGVRPSVAIMISNIYLQVTVPAAGSAPDYSATNNGVGCYVNTEYPGAGFRNGVYWYNDTDKKEMTPNDTFVKGKKYLVKVDVQAAPGWEFDLDKIITATVNGNNATVISPSGSISATNNFVQYTFTCENVVAVADCSVTGPLPGQSPSYTATVPSGKGYKVDEDFTDGTWINGVLWQNVTDNKDMTESDTFEAGKYYTATVLLDASDNNRPFASSIKATMNGKNANVIYYDDRMIGIYRSFLCPYVISDFTVTDVVEPVAGQSPSYTAAVPKGKGYRVKDLNGTYTKNGVMWRDENDQRLDPSTAKFEEGKTYKVYVYLEPIYDVYALASSDSTGTVNGKEAEIWGDSSQNHVFLIASFTCSSSSGYTLSGSYESFLDTPGITLELLKDGSQVRGAGYQDDNGTYSITNVMNGTYTLRVSKKNHVTRDYEVTVSGDTTQDVKIHPIGDINGDGATTTFDFALANSHAKGVSTLSGYESDCANIDGEGDVTTFDAAMINSHAKGVSLLY